MTNKETTDDENTYTFIHSFIHSVEFCSYN